MKQPDKSEKSKSVAASEFSQLMVTTHSPYFVNRVRANELYVLYRDEPGYTQAMRASEMKGINEFIEEGALLGNLWAERHFEVGDPLVNSGSSKFNPKKK